MLTLYRAWRKGRLPKNVAKLYRHTAGGPDNVAHVTHIVHGSMVWLGVFNDLEWFRFESGHSHIEIADRLFSLMKRLFETDSASRVRGVAEAKGLERPRRGAMRGGCF